MVVVAILGSVAFAGGISVQKKARKSVARDVFSKYTEAFSQLCVEHPGVINSRYDSCDGDMTGYTSKEGLKQVANYFNDYVEEDLKFVWDADLGVYKAAEDPWGGNYILCEYPVMSGFTKETGGYDATNGTGLHAMRCSIWVTGITDSMLESPEATITDEDVGVVLEFQNGLVSSTTQGCTKDNAVPYLDSIIYK